MSLVPGDWMLHIWHNPDHGIPLKDATRDSKTDSYLTSLDDCQPSAGDVTRERDPEEGFMQNFTHLAPCWVFNATPKKVGEPLWTNHLTDTIPPEGWGLYIEEGFRISWFFIAALGIYVIGSLAFAIVWLAKYKVDGAQAGFSAFGVSSWLVTLLSIIVTVWITSAKD